MEGLRRAIRIGRGIAGNLTARIEAMMPIAAITAGLSSVGRCSQRG